MYHFKSLSLLIACGWLFVQSAVVAGESSDAKLSPLLRKWVSERLTSVSMPRTDRTAAVGDESLLTTIAFVCADKTRGDSLLRSRGCRVYDQKDDIFIVMAPLDSVSSIASMPQVRRVEASAPCRLTMDTTSVVIGASKAYAAQQLPQAFTGSGVVVGVMDIGFDLTHPTFYDSTATHYRIGAFWDQLAAMEDEDNVPVGNVFEGGEQVLSRASSVDGELQTHGTHTAGIAAGAGYNSPYRGVAFESELCLVSNAVHEDLPFIDSTLLYRYTSASDALGFKYIFDYAAKQGKPAVASFSEGSYPLYSSDDSLYAEYLGKLTGPGRVIVASAGNEANKQTCLLKPWGKAQAGSAIACGGEENSMCLRGNGSFRLRLVCDDNNGEASGELELDTGKLEMGEERTDTLYHTVRGTITVKTERIPSSFFPSDSLYLVTLLADDPMVHHATRLLAILSGEEGEATLYTASFGLQFYASSRYPQWHDAVSGYNVLSPSVHPSVISVGATIHRTGFTNYLGTYYDYSQSGRNDGVWADYSSQGPTVDGRIKPDVCAPGSNVVSAYSSYYLEHNPDAGDILSDVAHFVWQDRTYAWNSNSGTSMATPVVAGVIALWMQAKPDLTPQEAMDVIAATSRHPEENLTYPNNSYGYGEIDAYAGLLYLLGLNGISDISSEPARELLLAAFDATGCLQLSFSRQPLHPVQLSLYDMSGKKLYRESHAYTGTAHCSVMLPTLPSGVYVVQLTSADKGCNGSLLIRKRQ